MIDVPGWVLEAVTDTHAPRWHATLIPVAGPPVTLPVTGGQLTIDAGAYPRTVADVTLGDLSLAPVRASDPLTPFGALLTLDYSIADTRGRIYTVRPCPPLIVDEVTVGRGRSTGLEVHGSDGSLAIDTDTYLGPTDPPPDADTVSALIAHLIRRTHPAAVIRDLVGSAQPIGAGFQLEGSPWAAVEALADTLGAEVFVDTDGAYVVRRIPPISATPAGVLATGPGGTIVGTSSSVVRGYNRVGLRVRDAAGASITGRWADYSDGPTDVRGRMGRVTLVEDRDRVMTQAQADDAAERYARRAAGRIRSTEVEAVAAPWFLPGDTLEVRLPPGADRLVLRSVEHDLTGTETSRYTFRTDTIGPV